MGIEIERKFLLSGDIPKSEIQYLIKQGYIDNSLSTLRVECGYLSLIHAQGNILHRIYIGYDAAEIIECISHDCKGNLIFDGKEIARIRIKGNDGYITIKGKPTSQGTPEFEYPVPLSLANDLLKILTKTYIEKIRHCIDFEGKLWEVDVFVNPPGLILAEVELSKLDEEIVIPNWVGEEVTGNPAYYNSEIIQSIKQ